MFTISAAHCWKPSRRTCQAKRRVGAPSLGTLNSRNGAKQQIVSPGAEPIPRLYAAGELGSRFGHLYLLGGNITECLVTGRVAGREGAGLEPWR